MAFPIRAYARALYESAEGKTREHIGEMVAQVLKQLRDHSSLGRSDELIAEIERLDDQAHGRLRARVTSAHKLDESALAQLEKKMKAHSHSKEIVWEQEVDKNLLGGVVVRYGDKVLDLSLASRLAQLAEEIKK